MLLYFYINLLKISILSIFDIVNIVELPHVDHDVNIFSKITLHIVVYIILQFEEYGNDKLQKPIV